MEKSNDNLWAELKDDFVKAFAHMGRVEQARIELDRLEMEGDLIDEYIIKYKTLLKKADIPHNEVGALQKFKEGLKWGVLANILRWDTWPEGIDDWQELEHAHREVRRMGIIKESLGDRGNYNLTTKQTKWCSRFQNFKKKKDEAIPMEVDAAKLNYDPKKKEELERLKKEGCCYKCQKQGHLKWECPNWTNEKKDKPPPYPSKACSTTTPLPKILKEDPAPSKEPQDMKQLARAMRTLDDMKTEELFNLIMDEDF
jgi:hypothetical protein